MSQVNYTSKIGTYGEDVQLDISLQVKGGMEKEDYETLRQSFQTIEDLTYKYTEQVASKVYLNKADV